MIRQTLIAAGLLLAALSSFAQTNTVGVLINTTNAYEGYTLFSVINHTNIYLIDNQGQLVNRWTSEYLPGHATYLLPNGNLLRPGRDDNASFSRGGHGGVIQEFNWEGDVLWEFSYSSEFYKQHHDTLKLPNGNLLILSWELKSEAESIAAGRDPSMISNGALWPEHLVEVQQTGPTSGVIVWEWHVWDHLIQDFDTNQANYGVVADHPELIDINFPGNTLNDWIHANALDYHPELDQIIISANTFGEFWIIDHSTTTGEAASHTGGVYGMGGDLLYRWGNPASYRAGTTNDRVLYNLHNPNWVDAGLPGEGNILIFNNGAGRPEGAYSSIEEVTPPLDSFGTYSNTPGQAFGPSNQTWQYVADPPTNFYGSFISGATRMPNGNTLICNGPSGIFFETDNASNIVWQYRNPVNASGPNPYDGDPFANMVFRAYRYGPDYAAFTNVDLTHQGVIELNTNEPLAMVELERDEAGNFLRWSSKPDTVYWIYAGEHIADGAVWTNIAWVDAISTKATFLDTDPGRTAATNLFYQVQEVQF